MTRVGVVGAGITGLALAHHLAERGADPLVLEADDEPGGVIRSTREGGRVLDHGPQRTRLTEPVGELVGAVGLDDELIEAADVPLYVYAGGELGRVPRSLKEFLTTDLLSVRGKLRVLAEPLTAPGRPDETAADLFARKFGTEACERVIGPLFGGIYGSDPARMPARHALSRLLELEEREGSLLWPALRRARGEPAPAVTFEDGMAALPRAIADRHADRIEFGTPVESVEPDGEGARIVADGRELAVDHAVLTTPADVTAGLLGVAAGGAERLGELNYNPLAVVHLVSDAGVEGFGYQIADRGFDTLGVSWNASLFGRDGVYTCFLGGMANPGLLERPDDELGRIAAEEFRVVVGAGAEVANVTRWERGFPAWDASWDALDDLSLPDRIHLATNYTGRMGVPSRVREARSLAEELTG